MSTDHSSVDTGAEVAGTEADKINTGALGTLVTVGLFAMLTITAAVTALVRHDIEAEEAIKDVDANKVVVDLKASQRAALTGPAKLLDRSKGVVSLPIDLAQGLVVSELARDPNSATPPAPAASAAPEAAAGGAGGTAGAGGAGKTANEAAPAGGGAKGAPEKAEPGRDVQKPAPGSANKPTPVPTPTPTAATPGAQAPGPIKK
ncbi:MAG TPA: hypothetical protein VFK05_32755 [Polyangiaceae bacterium]|nr:hypothetical protein [Polyangiaceae bacterium]